MTNDTKSWNIDRERKWNGKRRLIVKHYCNKESIICFKDEVSDFTINNNMFWHVTAFSSLPFHDVINDFWSFVHKNMLVTWLTWPKKSSDTPPPNANYWLISAYKTTNAIPTYNTILRITKLFGLYFVINALDLIRFMSWVQCSDIQLSNGKRWSYQQKYRNIFLFQWLSFLSDNAIFSSDIL